VQTARASHRREAAQPVAEHARPRLQMRLGPGFKGLRGEAATGESFRCRGRPASSTETAATKGTLFSEPRPALPPVRSPAR
jgi:hypothetical protein